MAVVAAGVVVLMMVILVRISLETVALLIDLMVSLKNYFIKKESYFEYLHKRGIDPKSIENAVKNIQ